VDWTIRISNLAGAKDFSVFELVSRNHGTHPNSYSVGTGVRSGGLSARNVTLTILPSSAVLTSREINLFPHICLQAMGRSVLTFKLRCVN